MHIFVSSTKFEQVLKIYTHLSKNYKDFVTAKLIFGNKMANNTLEMSSFLQYC